MFNKKTRMDKRRGNKVVDVDVRDDTAWFRRLIVLGCLTTLIVFSVLIWLAIRSNTAQPSQVDAFGRSRVSEPLTLSDSKNVHLADAEYSDLVLNGGAITHLADEASFLLSITGQTGSRTTRQTRMYHNYLPGKSQLILASFRFGAMNSGIIRRVGYFDDDNGVFLEQNGTDNKYYVVRREKTSGTVVETKISRDMWDKPLPEFDFTKVQLLKIDFQWLGVGKIRFFLTNAKEELIQTFFLANENTTVSFSEPNLPVRYEILNDSFVGGVGDSFDMQMICTTTMSEGGYIETGLDRHISTGPIHRTIADGGDELPVLAIKLKNSFEGKANRYYIRPGPYSIYVETHPVLFKIYRLESPSQLNGSWVSAHSSSPVEYNVSATTYSLVGGYQELAGGYAAASSTQKASTALNAGNPTGARKEIITQNFDSSDSQVWVIVCQALTSGTNVNSKIWAGIQWREVY